MAAARLTRVHDPFQSRTQRSSCKQDSFLSKQLFVQWSSCHFFRSVSLQRSKQIQLTEILGVATHTATQFTASTSMLAGARVRPAGHRWLPCRPVAFGSFCDAPSWWVRSCRIGAMNGRCCGGPSWKSNFRWPKIWRSCPQVWPCTLFYWEGIGCMNYYYLDMYNISIGSVWCSNDILESFERSVGF